MVARLVSSIIQNGTREIARHRDLRRGEYPAGTEKKDKPNFRRRCDEEGFSTIRIEMLWKKDSNKLRPIPRSFRMEGVCQE